VIGFLKIRIWGLPFLFLYQLSNALLVGINQSKFLVFGTLAEALINILLDYCLIYGHLGLPAMGFNGAAVASILAELSGMIVVSILINSRKSISYLNLYRKTTGDGQNLKLIINQSAPLVMQYTLSVVSWEFFYILIEHHGQRDLAISNTMRNLFGLFGCFTWAFASTTNTMVSNIIGQGRKDEVIGLIKKIMLLSVGFATLVGIALNIFPDLFLSIYGQNEAFTIQAIPVLRIVSSALVMMSASVIWLNAVTGTANTRVNLLIEIIAITCYSLYVYLVLGRWNLPITYGWMSEWLYWTVTFILSFTYIRSGKWKKKRI
jgi:Na+-driven multidrug efflux pump